MNLVQSVKYSVQYKLGEYDSAIHSIEVSEINDFKRRVKFLPKDSAYFLSIKRVIRINDLDDNNKVVSVFISEPVNVWIADKITKSKECDASIRERYHVKNRSGLVNKHYEMWRPLFEKDVVINEKTHQIWPESIQKTPDFLVGFMKNRKYIR